MNLFKKFFQPQFPQRKKKNVIHSVLLSNEKNNKCSVLGFVSAFLCFVSIFV